MRKVFFVYLILIFTGCSSSVLQGPQGVQGATGATGPQGDSCSTVSVSASGIEGRPDQYGGALITCGNSETFVSNGATGPTGNNGTNGTNGTDGAAGATGSQGNGGATGQTGPTGQAGTNVTTVEFCKDGQTVYPSNFPEQGICIDNNIFAVYWDKANLNAWLAEIIPGYYQSTATGLECDFTVLGDCQIEN